MVIALHCDQDGCDSWARTGSYAAGEFLTVTGHDAVTKHTFEHIFCTLDCVMQWAAAHSEATEEISA
jgi:hypothetical protein